MKKIVIILISIVFCIETIAFVQGEERPSIYAKSAILMEANSGRVMYEKDATKQLPNASTTKILTCYYIVKHGNLQDKVTISKNAARQPKVALGVRQGEQYYVKDLLYGLMLESYNDCAVALAEYMSKSVVKFEKNINQLAKEMGAKHTHFVTPNGLDQSDQQGSHRTTAYDLAMIMKHCIKDRTFLTITRRKNYTFQDVSGNRTFSCANHNALLSSMEGAVSGKTGFTSKAGYCYVGAVNQKNMTLIVVLLASGWPPHKSYKWQDTRKLITYGTSQYEAVSRMIQHKNIHISIPVIGGTKERITIGIKPMKLQYIKHKSETLKAIYQYPKSIQAPIKLNQNIGKVQYYLNNLKIKEQPIYAANAVSVKSMWWYLGKIIACFFKLYE